MALSFAESHSKPDIDLTITEGENEGKSILGIYQLDKDRLKWCTAIAGDKERPTDFASKPGYDGSNPLGTPPFVTNGLVDVYGNEKPAFSMAVVSASRW